jgi:large subunit ribosomal protein L23
MSRAPAQVIFGPLITERSYLLYQQGRYCFRVAGDASKPEIARALEEQYEPQGIKVVAVNTMRMRGKTRRTMRRGGPIGKTADWKKAIVTLQPGQKLEGLFGSV